MTEKILGEQLEKFKRKNNLVELKDKKFADYLETIMNMISADFAQELDRISTVLRDKAEAAKITDENDYLYKRVVMYPRSDNS